MINRFAKKVNLDIMIRKKLSINAAGNIKIYYILREVIHESGEFPKKILVLFIILINFFRVWQH